MKQLIFLAFPWPILATAAYGDPAMHIQLKIDAKQIDGKPRVRAEVSICPKLFIGAIQIRNSGFGTTAPPPPHP
jgi:hypothetical protein